MDKLQYDSLLIALGVLIPAAILAGPRIYKWRKARKDKRLALEKKRDDTLARLDSILGEIRKDQRIMGEDVRSLYPIQLVQLESLEISLMAIHGDGLNGNVGDAIKAVRKAKKDITDRVCSKVCGDIGEAVD